MNNFIAKHTKVILSLFIVVPVVIVIAWLAYSSQQKEKKTAELNQKFSSWVEVTGTLKPYKAFFPIKPSSQTKPDGGAVAKQETLAAITPGNESYFLSATVYPTDIESNDTDKLSDLLNSSLNGFSGELPQAEVLSRRIDPTTGNNILEFEVLNKSTQVYYKGRVIIKDDTLYQIWVESRNKYWSDEETYFVRSFNPGDLVR